MFFLHNIGNQNACKWNSGSDPGKNYQKRIDCVPILYTAHKCLSVRYRTTFQSPHTMKLARSIYYSTHKVRYYYVKYVRLCFVSLPCQHPLFWVFVVHPFGSAEISIQFKVSRLDTLVRRGASAGTHCIQPFRRGRADTTSQLTSLCVSKSAYALTHATHAFRTDFGPRRIDGRHTECPAWWLTIYKNAWNPFKDGLYDIIYRRVA